MTQKQPIRRSEIRKHYYLEQYVVISPGRHHSIRKRPFEPAGKWRPPDPETIAPTYEVKNQAGDWLIRVIPNLSPAFTPNNPSAAGYHEVILDTNPRSTPFSELPLEQIELILNTYCQRVSELIHKPHIKYVSVYHNTGLAAGASVQDTHTQVAAISIVPPDIRERTDVFTRLKKHYGVSPLAQAIDWEEQQAKRVIMKDKNVLAIAPFASQLPYEAWLVPRRAVRSICNLNAAEFKSMAVMLSAITRALEKNFLSYNFMLEEAVREMDNHFYIRITPRPNIWAGFELNTGMVINAMAPEDACTWYRGEIKLHHAG